MKLEQISLFDALALSEPPSFSASVSAQNAAEVPVEPSFKPSAKQLRAVWEAMKNGRWMTLAEIAHHAEAPEASVSARIRDLKKLGVHHEMRRALAGGRSQYRLITHGTLTTSVLATPE